MVLSRKLEGLTNEMSSDHLFKTNGNENQSSKVPLFYHQNTPTANLPIVWSIDVTTQRFFILSVCSKYGEKKASKNKKRTLHVKHHFRKCLF